MGWWFFKKEENEADSSKFNRMQELLKDAFSRIKTDITNLGAWVNYFEGKNKAVEERLARLESQALLPNYELKKISDKVEYLHSNIAKPHPEIELVHKRLDKLENDAFKTQVQPEVVRHMELQNKAYQEFALKLAEVDQKLAVLDAKKSIAPAMSNLQEKVVKNVVRNSKEYVMNLIQNLIVKYEHISGLKLKEIIVDEQGLCSKSTFYRILQETEETGNVGFLREGKEKKYFAKADKIQQKQA